MSNQTLQQQIDYYRARASEYDEWFLRQGRYDRGEAHSQQWFQEVGVIQQALALFNPAGKVLEFASGTGWWTEQLAQYAQELTCVDASPETIALNRNRLDAVDHSAQIRYLEADIFQWTPQPEEVGSWDVVFFSFWLSHVPPEQFDSFWAMVKSCLKPGGQVFFIDSLYNGDATARDQFLRTEQDVMMTRKLNDGREFEIVKVFYVPEDLASTLAGWGWEIEIRETEQFFLYGLGKC